MRRPPDAVARTGQSFAAAFLPRTPASATVHHVPTLELHSLRFASLCRESIEDGQAKETDYSIVDYAIRVLIGDSWQNSTVQVLFGAQGFFDRLDNNHESRANTVAHRDTMILFSAQRAAL